LFLGLVLLAGCAQSLFDNNRGPGDDGGVGNTCSTPCLGDAAANFDGTAGGAGSRWRYLDDHRNRTWTAMTGAAGGMTGADPANRITACATKPSAAACQTLPGALLVSSAGSISAADPALEFTSPSERVIQLSVRAFVPGGADQSLRIYRNSREDVLFTGTAFVGATLEHTVTVDALTGDRFLVAVAPNNAGAADVGLHVYVSGTSATFPKDCQIALPFSSAMGNTVDNVCGSDFTHVNYNEGGDDTVTPPLFAPQGPMPELGNTADFPAGSYFRGSGTLDRTHDTTLQFWVRRRAAASEIEFMFSDLDLDTNGGLSIGLLNPPDNRLLMQKSEMQQTRAAFADYPDDGSWNFVRAVHTNGNVYLCLNGARKTSFAVAAGQLTSTYPPTIGSNELVTPRGAFFDGQLDDVRLFSVALPCD
jgi:hypothetical protein